MLYNIIVYYATRQQNTKTQFYLYIIIGLWIWPVAWLIWAVGQVRARRRQRAWADDSAGEARGRGRRRAS